MTVEIAEKSSVAGGRRRWLLAGAGVFVAVAVAFAVYGFLHPLRLANEAVDLRLEWAGIHSRYVTVNGYRIHYYD